MECMSTAESLLLLSNFGKNANKLIPYPEAGEICLAFAKKFLVLYNNNKIDYCTKSSRPISIFLDDFIVESFEKRSHEESIVKELSRVMFSLVTAGTIPVTKYYKVLALRPGLDAVLFMRRT